MTTRYTERDVKAMFETLATTAKELGFDVNQWKLYCSGHGWRLYDDGKSPLGLSQGWLGSRPREAYDTLKALQGALWAVSELGLHHRGLIDGWREAATAFIRTGSIPTERPESGS